MFVVIKNVMCSSREVFASLACFLNLNATAIKKNLA